MWRKRICKSLERGWPDTSHGSCYRKTHRHNPESCKNLQRTGRYRNKIIISTIKNDKFFLITNLKHIQKKETANAVSFPFLMKNFLFLMHHFMLFCKFVMELNGRPVLGHRGEHGF